MKRILILLLAISILPFSSCSSDDDISAGNEYPKTVNIKFEITTTRISDAIINRTLDNDSQTENITSLPYSFTYAQQEVIKGTYLKLTYADNGVYVVDNTGSNWTDYDAELKITVGNKVVKAEMFSIVKGGGIVQIDYSFE